MISLSTLQSEIDVKKTEFNKTGGFYYRTAEGILIEAKKVLNKYNLSIVLSDRVREYGGKCYVEAKAAIVDENYKVLFYVTGNAAEETYKKGMDNSQKTGSASSYARKRALEGLFALDDEKQDADFDGTSGETTEIKLSRSEMRLKLIIEEATDIKQLEQFNKTIPISLKEIFEEKVKELKS